MCVCVFMCLLIVLESLTDFFKGILKIRKMVGQFLLVKQIFLWSGGASVCSSISSRETGFLGFSVQFLSMDSLH